MFTLLLSLSMLLGQAEAKREVVTGRSPPGKLDITARPAFPAYIKLLEKDFTEPSGNRALDAEETGHLVLLISNEGLGKGRIKVKLTPLTDVEHISFPRSYDAGILDVGKTTTVKVPIGADFEVGTMRREFRVEVVEEYYRDIIPFTFSFDTKAFEPPEFRVILKDYDDSREIFKRNNPDGSIDAGELIRVVANVQNVGTGAAEEVKVKVSIEGEGEEVHYRRDLKGSKKDVFNLGDMAPGEDRDVSFYFFTNPMFGGRKVAVTLDVTEARGKFGTSKVLTFDIGRSVPTEEVLAVESVRERRGEVRPVRSELVDVDRVPSGSRTKLEHGLAVIFGIERYKYTFPAAYKARDAAVFYKYCRDVLGIPEERIYLSTDDNATKGEFEYVFEPKDTPREGWLKKRLRDPERAAETDIIVYLGGHGFPDLSTGEPYFIPYDVRPEQATNGIPLKKIYTTLSEFGARSVVVFVEACFSGASGYRKGGEEVLLAKGMNPVFPVLESPLVGKRTVVFTATSGKRPSNNRDDLRHGIFTYFVLKGLGGEADLDGDGDVTVTEMYDYLRREVPKKALEPPLDREQVPGILPDPKLLGEMADKVLVRW